VDHLRHDPSLGVSAALAGTVQGPEPLRFEDQLAAVADLGRQLRRMLANLHLRLSQQERQEVSAVLAHVGDAIAAFEEGVEQ
jgi:hypothetical protein